jgi:putative DNA primase/helicase
MSTVIDLNKEKPLPLLAMVWFATLNEVRHADQLVKNLLLAHSLFVIFGESNTGKTFLLLDLALSIARGASWRGRYTRRGLVIYVAGESAESVRNRVTAYRIANPDIPGGLPFVVIPVAVDFLDYEAITALIATIKAAESECGEKATLVCIDTFARAIARGDENSTQDVGTAVAAADRIRVETGAAVGFVHHAGKDPSKGARGSSALRAAADTEILVEGTQNPRSVTVTKQRDLETGEQMGFELKSVQIGIDPDDGSPITSCVVTATEIAKPKLPKPKGKNQHIGLVAMREWCRSNPDKEVISTFEMAALCKSQSINSRRKPEVVAYLVDIGILTPTVGGHRINREAL